jgi:hypothetical protein
LALNWRLAVNGIQNASRLGVAALVIEQRLLGKEEPGKRA